MSNTAKVPRRNTDERRRVLEKAYRELATTPGELAAQREGLGALAEAARELGGKEGIDGLIADGTLSPDPATRIKQVVAGVGQLRKQRAEQQAAQDAEDRAIFEAAQRASNWEVEHLVAAAKHDPAAAEAVSRLQGALWRVRARDPEFVKGMVAQHGIAGAQAVLKANGGAEVIPLAAETYLSAKGDDWARAAQDLGFDDPTGLGASDTKIAKQLRSPEYQQQAAVALMRAGIEWEKQGPTPGHVAMRHMITVAERGAERTRLDEARLSDEEVAARAAELARGALGTAADAERTLQGVREGALELGLLHKLHERDEAKRKEHPATRSKADAERVEGERTRREALERAYDKHDTPEPAVNVDTGKVESVKGAVRVHAHNERKAALARGYAEISGEDVIVDPSSSGVRDLAKRAERNRRVEEREAASPRAAMSRAYDAIAARSETRAPEPAPSSTSSSPSADRRSVLSAEYDRLSSESEGA